MNIKNGTVRTPRMMSLDQSPRINKTDLICAKCGVNIKEKRYMLDQGRPFHRSCFEHRHFLVRRFP